MANKTKVEGCSTSSLDLLVTPYIINQVIQEIYKSGDLDKLYDDLNDDLIKKHNLDFKINKDNFKQYIVKTVTENENDFVKFLHEFNFESL